MNAVADYGYELHKAEQQERLKARLEFKALESELYRWGKWLIRECENTGYRKITPEFAALQGGGGGILGHVVLCLDWPEDVWATNQRVMRLNEIERDVIGLKYSVVIKEENGNFWTRTEWCAIYGITEDNFKKILQRARRKIQGLPPL